MIAPTVPPEAVRSRQSCRVSVVLPVYNEAAILRQLTDSVCGVLSDSCRAFEIIYVNDGSTDGSQQLLDDLARSEHRIRVIHLARNFGHQAAIHAGLEFSSGDVVVLMDSDLQDDPAAIPEFLSKWEDGYDVVYARRFNRKESLFRRFLFHTFYRVLNAVADSPMPSDAGNFSLMDRTVVEALRQLGERERYLPGLRSWTGFQQTGIPVERLARHDGHPRVSLAGLFKLAKTAIFSFSSVPLTIFYGIAAISAMVCLTCVSFVLYHKVCTDLAIPGWASTIITASFFGALNALGISVLGEYVIRIYDQVRARPVYLVKESRQSLPSQDHTVSAPQGEALELLEHVDAEYNRLEDAVSVRR